MADKVRTILARNVRLYRESFGYSQMKLAEIAGLSTSYIAAIETCAKFPSSRSIAKLADAFGVAPFQLFLDPDPESDSSGAARLGELKEDLKGEIAEQIESYFRRYFSEK